MRVRLALLCALLLALSGCAPAPVSREPDNLALVRALGVDGGGPVTLTAVCGMTQGEVSRGSSTAGDFEQARALLPWSGKGEELSLTGVSYLLVGSDADLPALLLSVLENEELGAAITVWLVEDGAAKTLDACDDPAADLELLTLRGVSAPTVAQAAAAIEADGSVTLPCLRERDGRLQDGGTRTWSRDN